MEPKQYKIGEDVLNATLQYLGSKPYAEVAKLVQVLSQSKPVEEPVKDSKK